MGIIERNHPLQAWADRTGTPLRELATAARCSETHLINLLAGRKGISLKLAKRLSDLTGVPLASFLKDEDDRKPF